MSLILIARSFLSEMAAGFTASRIRSKVLDFMRQDTCGDVNSTSAQTSESHVSARYRRVIFTLVLGFGSMYALLMPPFQSSDEHGHFVRAYEITRGNLFPDSDAPLPRTIVEAFERYPTLLEDHRRLSIGELWSDAVRSQTSTSMDSMRVPPDIGLNYVHGAIIAADLYFPAVYLPAAAGIGFARLWGANPYVMLYTARLAGVLALVVALGCVYLLAYDIRVLIAACALTPTSLHQAASVTADTATIALSWIALGMVLRSRRSPVTSQFLLILVLVFGLLGLCKTSVWAFPLALVVPRRQFSSGIRHGLFVLLVTLAMFGSAAVWLGITRPTMEKLSDARMSQGKDIRENVRIIRQNPILFCREMLIQAIQPRIVKQTLARIIAAFGWQRFTLTPLPLALYLVAMIGIAFVEPSFAPLRWSDRVLLLGASAAAAGILLISIFSTDARCSVGARLSECFDFRNVQGRYFLPFLPTALLAFRYNRPVVRSEVLYGVVALVAIFVNVIGLWTVFHHYYD